MLDATGIHVLTYDEQGEEIEDRLWEKEPDSTNDMGSPWLKDAKGILLFKAKIPISEGKIWGLGERVPIWETQFPWRRGWGRVFADPWCIRGIWFPWKKPRPRKAPDRTYELSTEWNIPPQELLGR